MTVINPISVPRTEDPKEIRKWREQLSKRTQPHWDDLRVSLSTGKVPASNYPNWAQIADDSGGTSIGIFAYHFDDGEYIFLTTQMPHGYREGSTIYPHIHFRTLTDVSPADNFKIGLEYSWSDIGDTLGNTTTISRDISTGVNTALDHQIANISATGIDGTGMGISSIFEARLYRAAADSDNYAGQIMITDFDIHYQQDLAGSREILAK